MHLGMLRGLVATPFISWPTSSGTSVQPSLRAAIAGNSALRSVVVVNQTPAISAGSMALASISRLSSSRVEASISAASSLSTVVAPRMPRTGIRRPPWSTGRPSGAPLDPPDEVARGGGGVVLPLADGLQQGAPDGRRVDLALETGQVLGLGEPESKGQRCRRHGPNSPYAPVTPPSHTPPPAPHARPRNAV